MKLFHRHNWAVIRFYEMDIYSVIGNVFGGSSQGEWSTSSRIEEWCPCGKTRHRKATAG